ncbi:MAG: hypothetical protein JWQ89_1295 [Devosia sp.]|uniref:hypothetical protein n=1 Tax=Devosia sp. TaxID=1871048 RepID=UPI00262799C2|nr:hypothetical protein [Devosia sp.]MDB5539568.1 hypothetical protein [Devosia sp.]
MHSQSVSVLIEQSFDQVYGFLVDPLNFPSWGPVADVDIQYIGGLDWLVDQRRHTVIRFTEPNIYGVLDFSTFQEGGPLQAPTPVRVTANGDAAELTALWRQKPGVSDVHFASEIVLIEHYFDKLKILLEADPEPDTNAES